MPNRYSRDELEEIKALVVEGLTNRDIAVQVGRPEAGIKNLRYRLNLKRETKDNIRFLRSQKEGLEARIQKLNQSVRELSGEVRSLEEKKAHLERVLTWELKMLKMKIESHLIGLKIEKPELFYISGSEQMVKLGIEFLKWLAK